MKVNRTFERIFAIPDIHGRSDLLKKAFSFLETQSYDPQKDMLIFLGDMIDRGPDCKGVIDLIKQKVEANPESVFALRGNHEDFAIDVRVKGHSDKLQLWYMNGGLQTEDSYPNQVMSEEHLRFIGSLPYHVEAQGFYFSHAPVPREHKRNGRTKMWGGSYGYRGQAYNVWERTWHYIGPECERSGAYMDVHEGPKSDNGTGSENLTGVCGHIHRLPSLAEARLFPKYRMLDAGCGCSEDAPLTVHECLSERTYYIKP